MVDSTCMNLSIERNRLLTWNFQGPRSFRKRSKHCFAIGEIQDNFQTVVRLTKSASWPMIHGATGDEFII